MLLEQHRQVASMDLAKTTARRCEKRLNFGIGASYIRGLTVCIDRIVSYCRAPTKHWMLMALENVITVVLLPDVARVGPCSSLLVFALADCALGYCTMSFHGDSSGDDWVHANQEIRLQKASYVGVWGLVGGGGGGGGDSWGFFWFFSWASCSLMYLPAGSNHSLLGKLSDFGQPTEGSLSTTFYIQLLRQL